MIITKIMKLFAVVLAQDQTFMELQWGKGGSDGWEKSRTERNGRAFIDASDLISPGSHFLSIIIPDSDNEGTIHLCGECVASDHPQSFFF